VAATAVVAVAYAPWSATARPKGVDNVFGGPIHPTLDTFSAIPALFPGQPFSHVYRPTLDDLPGVVPLLAVALGLAVALLGLVARPRAARPAGEPRAQPRTVALVALLAIAAPLAVFLYSLVAHDIYFSRYLSPSLPCLLLLVGWLVASARRPGALALALVVGGMLVGTAKTLSDEFRRPPYDDVAAFIDARARPGDSIVKQPLTWDFLEAPLRVQLDAPLRQYFAGVDARAWRRAERGGRVFVVSPMLKLFPLTPRAGPSRCFTLADRLTSEGVVDIGVGLYTFGAAGRFCLRAPRVRYDDAFSLPEHGAQRTWRWIVRPRAQLDLIATAHTPRRVRVEGLLASATSRGRPVTVRYPDSREQRLVVGAGTPVRRDLRLRRGVNRMTISTPGSPTHAPGDPRPLYVRLEDFSVGSAG
jgi:hypothetical protein